MELVDNIRNAAELCAKIQEEKPKVLSNTDYEEAAKYLGIETAIIKAVAEVESAGSGFTANNRCIMRFEPHVFGSLTQHRYKKSIPLYKSKYPVTSNTFILNVGPVNIQPDVVAYVINYLLPNNPNDAQAALKSASYGKFQIMGFNYALTGATNVMDFVREAVKGEKEQLWQFVRFLEKSKLVPELKKKDWHQFARWYNGPNYARQGYHILLEKAYKKHLKNS